MKRVLQFGLLLLLIGLFGQSASAMQRIWGYCSAGGVIPTVSGLSTSVAVQASYPGCTITVFLAGTIIKPTNIYSDNNFTVLSNPFVGDINTGYWEFYAANGRYDVQLSGAGIATPFTIGDLLAADSLASGGPAAKPLTSDAIQYVSPNGNDANDGLSMGTAKLTVGAACAALPSGNSGCTAGSGAIFITPGFSGTVLLPAAPGILIFQQKGSWQMNSLGTFTTGATHENMQVLVNGCNPTTEFQATFTHTNLHNNEAITGCIVVPSTSTNDVSTALSAYLVSSSSAGAFIPLYSQSRCLANSSSCWGAQLVAQDSSTTTGTNLYGLEVDINDMNPAGGTTNFFGIDMFGNFPASTFAIGYALNPPSGGGTWGSGFRSLVGATTNGDAFVADPINSTATAISQSIVFEGKNSGVNHPAVIYASALGDVTVQPDVGRSILDLGGLQEPLSTKSSPYTLTASDSWINVTGTTTITVPHALTGQRWHVKNTGANVVSLVPDSGNIDGFSGAPFQSLMPQASTEVTCDGTNCQTGLTFPYTIGEVNLTGRTTNLGPTTINLGVPAGGGGMYRATCYVVETTNAGTSSTLPQCNILFTDLDSSVAENFQLTATNAGNTVGSTGFSGNFVGSATFNAKGATNIQYQTSGYASNPATTMQYSLYLRLENLGP